MRAISALFSLVSLAAALPSEVTRMLNAPRKIGRRCTGEIQSLSDVAAAQECTTIVIGGFTVPAGQTFTLNPPDGASVSLTGQLTFGVANWDGPLMVIEGNDITFNGGGHTLDGQGASYWDGEGTSGGVTKPAPLLRINMGGTFTNLKVANTPARAIAIGGSDLTVSGVTVDNSAGASLGKNTDGFDVSASNVIITGNTVVNQDDCLAINKGTNITFSNNSCTGGHGISIGSIKNDTTVNDVTISGNTVTNNVQALRIKTYFDAVDSTVSNVVYSNNKATGTTSYGVIIDQSYPSTLGTPGTGVVIENIKFSGSNTIAVDSSAHRVEINCGSTSSCKGTWDFSGLTVTGGKAGSTINASPTGGSY